MGKTGRPDKGVYYRATRQKEYILSKLRERGLRITNQRRLIIDCILEMSSAVVKKYTVR